MKNEWNWMRIENQKKCFIMRGLSGSGKSKRVDEILSSNNFQKTAVFSTDDIFMENGEYNFRPEKLKEYHDLNYHFASRFMKACGKHNVSALCIIDNTNTMKWEYERYEESAKEHGFEVVIVKIDWNEEDIPLYAERNSHGVPEEVIRNQAARWED